MREPSSKLQERLLYLASPIGLLAACEILLALGLYPSEASIGSEGAGVVLELGPGVSDLAVGDRVMGMFSGFGTFAVADRCLLARLPEAWSFARAWL